MFRWMGACVLAMAAGQIISPPLPGQTAGQPGGRVPAAPAPRPVAPPAPSSIVGQVVDSRSGRAIARAVVRLVGAGGNVVQTRLADDRGRFYFKGVQPGDFRIAVERMGYFNGSFGQRRASGDGTLLTVGSNVVVGSLRVEVFKPSVIAGSVLDEAGEPIVGVPVHALRREYVDGAWRFDDAGNDDTDDQGDYRINDLMPGDYVITVPSVKVTIPNDKAGLDAPPAETGGLAAVLATFLTAPQNGTGVNPASAIVFDRDQNNLLLTGRAPTPPPRVDARAQAYPTAYYVGSDLLRQAMPITLAPGETRTAVRFQLRPVPAARISGRLVGSIGPVPDRPLRLLVDGDDDLGIGTEVAVTVTARDGSFTFLDVPRGQYVIEARSGWEARAAADGGQIAAEFSNELGTDSAGWTRQPIRIDDDDLAGVLLTLTPPVNLRGQVRFESARPEAPAVSSLTFALAAVGTAISGLPRAPVGGGEFHMKGVPPGRYVLRVTGVPAGWSLKSARLDGIDVLESAFDLRGTPSTFVVTLTDRISKTIGTVRDVRGLTQATATVLAFPADRRDDTGAGVAPHRMRGARVNGSGVFRIDGLPPGDYVFVAIDDAAAEGWQDRARLDQLAPLGTRVTLRESDQRTIDLRQVTVR